MIIYFSFSLSQLDEKIKQNCKILITALKNADHLLFPKNLINKVDNPHFYKKQNNSEKIKAQEILVKLKKTSDIIIFETSFPSTSIGQELEFSIANNKPVLAIYHEEYKNHILVPHNYDNFLLLSYNNTNIKNILNDGLIYLRKQQPKRFNLMLSSELNSYLNTTAKKEKTSKAQFLRSLLINHRENS